LRKCTGNNTQEWEADAIFDVKCKKCGELVEFFKDEITRNCSHCPKRLWMWAMVFIVIFTYEKFLPQI
jgi:predicted Zn-ribbon and HTH transcriptional regulator